MLKVVVRRGQEDVEKRRNRVCFSVMFIAGYVGFCDKI